MHFVFSHFMFVHVHGCLCILCFHVAVIFLPMDGFPVPNGPSRLRPGRCQRGGGKTKAKDTSLKKKKTY